MPALERPSNSTLALHYAAARGCLDCVRLLADSTPDLNANTQMDNDVTPVYLAAQEGHLDVLKFLVLEAGGSLYVRAKDGMAPLHAASQMGCLNCVKWMVQDQQVDPNLRDGDGATPLHFAASRGHLDTVRWLLKHGARLSLDKFGKSPINDAAENQQVECLNVLVQHGATPNYESEKTYGKCGCSCTRKSDQKRKGDCSTCKSNNQEPFYLHPPLANRSLEAAHAPQDGLYINPMNNHRHSISSGSDISLGSGDSVSGDSFYLHNPEEVVYNRVKDLFASRQAMSNSQPLSALTVKVEVHSSSSGAGSDENLSSSELSSERSADHDHDYEDIYLVKEKNDAKTNNARNHSRSSSSANVIVKVTSKEAPTRNTKLTNEFLPKPQKLEKANKKKDSGESGLSSSLSTLSSEEDYGRGKLSPRHSLPPKSNGRLLKRAPSAPTEVAMSVPPPPPPLPLPNRQESDYNEEMEKRGAEIVEVVEEPTLKPSAIAKNMVRSMSSLSATRRHNSSSCSDLTIISLEKATPNLVNKQRALPFVPPSFPAGSSAGGSLIKPSEYLRSLSDRRSSGGSSDYEDAPVVIEEVPPPPPFPTQDYHQNRTSKVAEVPSDSIKKLQQPLSAISIQDLNSVQLRRTDNNKMMATRSVSLQCLQSDSYIAQKTDLIAELKQSKDITGIKKMKIERAKCEERHERQTYTEISKQYTINNFVEKIPDRDNTGNAIPEWKRQMLAKKAAEKAKKELEDRLHRDAELKRLQSIPQWKRQLIAKKEEAEHKIRSTIYTPKVEEPKKAHDANECLKQYQHCMVEDVKDYNKPQDDVLPNGLEEEQTLIPWRAQLRKTNSKLNLLD